MNDDNVLHLLFLMLVALFSVACLSDVDSSQNSVAYNNDLNEASYPDEDEFLAESETRPKRTFFRNKRKQSPSLMALNRLVLDTVNDTSIAYRNISLIMNRLFGVEVNIKNDTTPVKTTTSNNRTIPVFPVNQLFDLLGSNYRGLVRLFNREFLIAVNDSRKNAVRYRKEFMDAVRPFFVLPWNRNNTVVPKK